MVETVINDLLVHACRSLCGLILVISYVSALFFIFSIGACGLYWFAARRVFRKTHDEAFYHLTYRYWLTIALAISFLCTLGFSIIYLVIQHFCGPCT